LKGVEKVTGENVAGAIIDYVKGNYKQGGRSGTTAEIYDQQSGLSNNIYTPAKSTNPSYKYFKEMQELEASKKRKEDVVETGKGTVIKLGHNK